MQARCESLEGRIALASYAAGTVPQLFAAIDQANLSPEDDTITLTAATFSLTEPHGTPDSWASISASGSLSINGNGATIERSGRSGTPSFRFFEVAPGAALHLNDLTLQGGESQEYWDLDHWVAARGGAILNQGSLSLDGVTIQNNVARGYSWDHAPGYAASGGDASGGGVYSSGSLTISGSLIRNNMAIGGYGPDGFLTFSGPAPGGPGGNAYGGGVSISGGDARIAGTTIISNTALGGNGGDGYSLSKGSKDGQPTRGGNGGNGLGGGVYVAGGSATFHVIQATNNNAQAGLPGAGGKQGKNQAPRGEPGVGKGGGIAINELAIVALDSFTKQYVKSNKASSGEENIAGAYTLLS